MNQTAKFGQTRQPSSPNFLMIRNSLFASIFNLLIRRLEKLSISIAMEIVFIAHFMPPDKRFIVDNGSLSLAL